MWAHIVVIDLIAWNDRRLRLLESMHDLFSVSDFAVESFHLVVVPIALNPDAVDVLVSCCLTHCVELFQVCLAVGW